MKIKRGDLVWGYAYGNYRELRHIVRDSFNLYGWKFDQRDYTAMIKIKSLKSKIFQELLSESNTG